MEDNTVNQTNQTTNAPAVTAPPTQTPALDKLKSVLSDKDNQIADLKKQLTDAVTNGNALNAKVAAMADTIDQLHNQLADYSAVETFLGL